MRRTTSREDATLIDVLIDAFEKNQVFGGFHWRDLPMPDDDSAHRKFLAFNDEARRWKGAPTRSLDDNGRRLAAWPDLEIRQLGRGVMVRVRAPGFDRWWHAETTWNGIPWGQSGSGSRQTAASDLLAVLWRSRPAHSCPGSPCSRSSSVRLADERRNATADHRSDRNVPGEPVVDADLQPRELEALHDRQATCYGRLGERERTRRSPWFLADRASSGDRSTSFEPPCGRSGEGVSACHRGRTGRTARQTR